MKLRAHIYFLGFFLYTLNASLTALENTIYIRFESESGDFPDSTYHLDKYKVTLENNQLLIDDKRIFNATGKQTVELFVENNSIHLKIDNSLEIVPNM